MNNAEYLINQIKYAIPIEILEMSFMETPNLNDLPLPLNGVLKNKIIIDKVGADCNLVSGIEAIVDLSNADITQLREGSIYRIGLSVTNGRRILSVLSVGYGYSLQAPYQPTIASAATDMISTSDAKVELSLTGINTIYVPGMFYTPIATLRCILENDPDLGNIAPRLLPHYRKLCILATKFIIYNTMRIKLGTAEVRQGIALGVIKEYIDSYSSAEEEYYELMEKTTKMGILGDRASMNAIARMLSTV